MCIPAVGAAGDGGISVPGSIVTGGNDRVKRGKSGERG